MFFPSKRSVWFAIITWGIFPPALLAIVFLRAWVVAPVLLIALGLVMWLWFDTGYTLTDSELRIKAGPSRRTVALGSIRQVRRSHDAQSAPALSLDRLAIRYGPGSSVLISPRDAEQFLALLKERCPQADISL